ncbi:hypothetical protein V9T40_007969 [Parthenolecanium corni]|uniref:Uncharacterized protein n=1 Tax=Parthenolecanium corni TaxID=536013 RepID=A0AAN9TT90_9HEMI
MSHFMSSWFNFRLVVSFFGWMSQFSAGCLIFFPAASLISVWMSQFSAGCHNFRLDVSFFSWLSHFSSSCLNFRLDVSFHVQLL